jgi:hypothetical protein
MHCRPPFSTAETGGRQLGARSSVLGDPHNYTPKTDRLRRRTLSTKPLSNQMARDCASKTHAGQVTNKSAFAKRSPVRAGNGASVFPLIIR